MTLPNLFLVGAPKTGTTSLFNYLKEHPEIFLSKIKEPNFFSIEEIEKQNLYYQTKSTRTLSDYKKLFSKVKKEKVIGEASVSYLFYPEVPSKIKKLIPEAKIIIILRNPADRAFSHYLMDWRLGYVHKSFEDIIKKKRVSKKFSLHYQQYIELGFYYQQVNRYLNTFGHEKIFILIDKDLEYKTRETMVSLFKFLGIDKAFPRSINVKYNVFRLPKNMLWKFLYQSTKLKTVAKSIFPDSFLKSLNTLIFNEKRPQLNLHTRTFLISLYKKDIKKLEKIINRDLRHWYDYAITIKDRIHKNITL